MNLIILTITENSIPDWFIWFGIEAHKLITPVTGIISAGWAIILLTKLKNTGKQRAKELNDLAEQTLELRKITISAQEQILELKNQTQYLKETNSHLERSVSYQSELLEQAIESQKLAELKEKMDRRPYFNSWINDCKNSPLGPTTIGIINYGEVAMNVKIFSSNSSKYLQNEPLKYPQVNKSTNLIIPLASNNPFDHFMFKIEFEDSLGNKYSQECWGNWRNYQVYDIRETRIVK